MQFNWLKSNPVAESEQYFRNYYFAPTALSGKNVHNGIIPFIFMPNPPDTFILLTAIPLFFMHVFIFVITKNRIATQGYPYIVHPAIEYL
jgi:hypothetical protein